MEEEPDKDSDATRKYTASDSAGRGSDADARKKRWRKMAYLPGHRRRANAKHPVGKNL